MKPTEIKKHLLKPVMYEGTQYIMTECILWVDPIKRKLRYSCTLLDKSKNCTVRAAVEKVGETPT